VQYDDLKTTPNFVNEQQDKYDLKTRHGFYLKSHDFVGSSTWKMGIEVIVLTEYLLCTATHTPWKFYCRFQKKEIWVQRGEILKSISRMITEIEHLSRQQIRTALEKLKSSNFLEDITPKCVKGTNSYKHLKICKYDGYQDLANYLQPYSNHTATIQQPYSNHDLKKDKELKEREEKSALDARRTKCATTKGTRIPDDFQLNAELIEIGKAIGLNGNIEFVYAKFRSYWEGIPGQKGVKVNWKSTWRNWCLNECEKNGGQQSLEPNPFRTGQEAKWQKGDDAF